jgi:iron complex transport system substrate-binding protein
VSAAPRICSLLPSATEIVFALGLGERLVGVTHECDYPVEAANLPVVTASTLGHGRRDSREIHHHIAAALHAGSSIYTLDQALLERLDPDLILTQELCDVCAVAYREVERAVHRLEGRHRTVLSLEPTTLHAIIDSVRQVGEVAGVAERAAAVADRLRADLDAVAVATAGVAPGPRVLALEWLDPPMAAGHWVPEMIRLAGGADVLGRAGQPSERVEWARIAAAAPDIVVLMPCGFGLDRTIEEHARTAWPPEWSRLPAVQAGQVHAVDGSSYFNRPGPRIVTGARVLAEILHPARVPRTTPPGAWRRLA